MNIQVRKRNDPSKIYHGYIELLENGKPLVIMTSQQAETLAKVLLAATIEHRRPA